MNLYHIGVFVPFSFVLIKYVMKATPNKVFTLSPQDGSARQA